MRHFPPLMLAFVVACGPPPQPPASPTPGRSCAFAPADSVWLHGAVDAWRTIGAPRLRVRPDAPLPPLILFDRQCVHHLDISAAWRVHSQNHGGTVGLPNGQAIPPVGIGITSPTTTDSAIFLALALPDAWRADPRYRGSNDGRLSWERYLVGAFTHEMAHAQMLPGLVPRLRAVEASIFPDTIEDNLIQARFGSNREFAQGVARETELLYRAARAGPTRVRQAYARAALAGMRARRERFYRDDYAGWDEVEQIFLDLEGVAQWAALGHSVGSLTAGPAFDRALARFRASREFWSEDQGLALILALDALVPGWQARLIGPAPVSSFHLLTEALREES